MPSAIAVSNQKGGVGKTTTAVTLAHGLAIKGKRVLLIDLDAQGQVSTLLGIDLLQVEGGRKGRSAAWELLVNQDISGIPARKNLDLIWGGKDVESAQAMLQNMGADGGNRYLFDVINRALENYDFVIFDTAPSKSRLQSIAICASDYLLIPAACDYLSSEGVIKLISTAKIDLAGDWTGEVLGILPTFFDEQTKETKAVMKDLNNYFPGLVLSPIHRATILRETAAIGKTILEFAPESRAAEEYQAIIDHVMRTVK